MFLDDIPSLLGCILFSFNQMLVIIWLFFVHHWIDFFLYWLDNHFTILFPFYFCVSTFPMIMISWNSLWDLSFFFWVSFLDLIYFIFGDFWCATYWMAYLSVSLKGPKLILSSTHKWFSFCFCVILIAPLSFFSPPE